MRGVCSFGVLLFDIFRIFGSLLGRDCGRRGWTSLCGSVSYKQQLIVQSRTTGPDAECV